MQLCECLRSRSSDEGWQLIDRRMVELVWIKKLDKLVVGLNNGIRFDNGNQGFEFSVRILVF